MLHLIDRRPNGRGKSAVNRERFLRRYKAQIQDAVKKMIGERRLADMEQGGEVRVPRKDISEPSFGFGTGGDREFVLPGNREYVAGDRIPRPDGSGSARGAGNEGGTGDSEDAFVFSLSREEFMQIFFDDLELPNLARTEFGRTERRKSVRAGFTKSGVPANLAVVRTLTQSLARRIALGGGLSREMQALDDGVRRRGRGRAGRRGRERSARSSSDSSGGAASCRSSTSRTCATATACWRPEPIARAAMFCLMDVSASMDEDKKDLAKRFFTLLYLFLTRKYAEVELIFIRHTDDAEEVDEERFFHDTRSGGTVVLSALELADKIRAERYAQRLERLRGAGLRRRRLRCRSRPQRALPARAAAAGDALLHVSGAGRAVRAGPRFDAVGRVRAGRRGERQLRDAPRERARADLSGVPRAVPQGNAMIAASMETVR